MPPEADNLGLDPALAIERVRLPDAANRTIPGPLQIALQNDR
jgi:hypothetical protein